MDLIVLLLALAGLWLGTDWTLRSAVAIASRLGVSEFVVGVAVLSVGSDLPELSIAVSGALQNLRPGPDASDIVVGSALGSALGQLGFVLGVVGLGGHLALRAGTVCRHGSVLLGSLVALAVAGMDGDVTRLEGLTLVAFYGIYLLLLLRGDARAPASGARLGRPARYDWAFLAAGLAVVTLSAELTVRSAIAVAAWLGVDDTVVAVLIIGMGSSLPELSISLAAAFRRASGLSVGNLIGSNIFDTLVPIGVAAVIAPLAFDPQLFSFELPVLAVVTAAALAFLLSGGRVRPLEAAVLLVLYGGYVLARINDAPPASPWIGL